MCNAMANTEESNELVDPIKILIIWHKYKPVFHMTACRLTHMTLYLKNVPYKMVNF